jgi:hypothetical protein
MIEKKERIVALCPRCGGNDIYKVTEIEEENSPMRQRIPTRYTACFTADQDGNKCWYHFTPANKAAGKRFLPRPCKVEGCLNNDIVNGRSICVQHYNALCLERYHKKYKKTPLRK